MIPAKHQQLVFVFFMTLLMGLVLSFVFKLQAGMSPISNIGAFVVSWLRSFLATYVIVVPVVLCVNPVANWLTKQVVKVQE